jgi:transposase
LFWLTEAQMDRLRPFFPKSHGHPRVGDRRVLRGIIFINRNGLRWCDAPRDYGPPKTLYNRWKLWSGMGGFARIMEGLASEAAEPKTVMIASHSLLCNQLPGNGRDLSESASHGFKPAGEKRGGRGRAIGRTKGGMNTKLHAIADAKGRPLKFFMTAGEVSDYTGAVALLSHMPTAEWLLAASDSLRANRCRATDRGYDADWYPEALKDKGIRVCIPGRKNRKKKIRFDRRRYKRRNRIEIMFGRLKDWRRIAT